MDASLAPHLPAEVLATPEDSLELYLPHVVPALLEGRLIPFFGAGVNQCGRPKDVRWIDDAPAPLLRPRYPPTGAELASYLASTYKYNDKDVEDLLRVSEFVAMMRGEGALYERLRTIFNADYPITAIHQLFARVPEVLRRSGCIGSDDPTRAGYMVITTNYDDVLERAFEEVGEPFHTLTYMADGEFPGLFRHRLPTGEQDVVTVPVDRYDKLRDLKDCTVLLKIHGAVDRASQMGDSFVITEDHYIEYLARTELKTLLPIAVGPKLEYCHFLFLGYSLRDWNFRAIFQRLRSRRHRTVKSWAIQSELHPLDQKLWAHRDVEIIKVDLSRVVNRLAAQFDITLPQPLAGADTSSSAGVVQ